MTSTRDGIREHQIYDLLRNRLRLRARQQEFDDRARVSRRSASIQ